MPRAGLQMAGCIGGELVQPVWMLRWARKLLCHPAYRILIAACRCCRSPATHVPLPCPAERYQLSGGEGSRGGWKAELGDMQAEVTAAQAELHGDSEADEGSVAWPDSDDGGGEVEGEGSLAGGCSRGEDEGEDASGTGSPAGHPQHPQVQQHSQSQPQRA